jgi:hypothetical protein
MQKIVINIEDKQYGLFLQFLQTLEYVRVHPPKKATVSKRINKFDFSDLTGKLEWKGDAVTQQRILRDEW